MSIRGYTFFLAMTTMLSWIAWVAVVIAINPLETEGVGIALFYISLSLALAGTFSLVGFLIRTVFIKKEEVFSRVGIALRQAVFFTLLVDGFLFLQSMRLLTWYNTAFLIIALAIAEFVVISNVKHTPIDDYNA
ncbi:hypothetical protein HYW94_02145 [Candidatus Uhrbacteria bacterium]|nr:hypothetical protein [Candidatus Uhrbacteria bacterium]